MITFRQGKIGLGMSIPHIRIECDSRIYLFKTTDYRSMIDSLRLAAPYERKSARLNNLTDFETYYRDLKSSVLDIFSITDSLSHFRKSS
ncbi:hypothetical protein [Vibrio parahaemolyticus]|uniref:hypothetical protein n=1 Tax=Vibrio parahaemolyticus TaxID=670 RepID=UPI001120CF44|nr:hypothetical protein [Vibrio parahaemolyticus]